MSEQKTAQEVLKQSLLDAVLPNVAFDGWSETALRRAAEDIGAERGLVQLAVPRGALDLAAAFHEAGDAEMLSRLDDLDFEAMRIRDKITYAVRTRLEIAEPHEEAVRRASSMNALPLYAPEGAKLVWNTADAIWNAVGDTSDDYNWYTKRMTLSGVFSSTLLFWLGDTSPGREATWCFLDRRIGNVMDFEKLKSRVRKNPLARIALSGPKAILSRVRPPADPAARAEGLDVGFPGRPIS